MGLKVSATSMEAHKDTLSMIILTSTQVAVLQATVDRSCLLFQIQLIDITLIASILDHRTIKTPSHSQRMSP